MTLSLRPSPFGDTKPGRTVTLATASGAPTVPVADRAPGVSIAYEYDPGSAALASQVQSTALPLPEPASTTSPRESVTVTVQRAAADTRAVKRTGPRSFPATAGA